MLMLIRLLLGAAEALFSVADFAALADLAPPGRAGEALSWNSLVLYVGIAVGSGVGQLRISRSTTNRRPATTPTPTVDATDDSTPMGLRGTPAPHQL
jgi:predicted MFS family arabinose efflux permease